MSTTANQPQIEPELRQLLHRLLRGLCVVAALLSAFFAAHGVVMTGQILSDEVPPGKVQAIVGHSKSGPRVRLENGLEVVFSNLPLYRRPEPVRLSVGDRVEKRRDSCVYVVNGTSLTDVSWLLREFLLPLRLLVPLGVYLSVGAVFVLKYRRTPHGELIWSDADPKRPRRPRTGAGLGAMLLVNWLGIFGLMTAGFACIWGCLYGIGKAAFG